MTPRFRQHPILRPRRRNDISPQAAYRNIRLESFDLLVERELVRHGAELLRDPTRAELIPRRDPVRALVRRAPARVGVSVARVA
jgi:hypothetical protein